MAHVYLPAALINLFPGAPRRLDLDAATVEELIDGLNARWPGMRDRLCTSEPAIRQHINVFVAGERAGLRAPLPPGAVVRIIPAVSGGSESSVDPDGVLPPTAPQTAACRSRVSRPDRDWCDDLQGFRPGPNPDGNVGRKTQIYSPRIRNRFRSGFGDFVVAIRPRLARGYVQFKRRGGVLARCQRQQGEVARGDHLVVFANLLGSDFKAIRVGEGVG